MHDYLIDELKIEIGKSGKSVSPLDFDLKIQSLNSKVDGIELRLHEANDKTYASINAATKNMFNEHSVQLSGYLSRLESLEKFYEKLSSRFGSIDNTVHKLKNDCDNNSSNIAVNSDDIYELKELLSLKAD